MTFVKTSLQTSRQHQIFDERRVYPYLPTDSSSASLSQLQTFSQWEHSWKFMPLGASHGKGLFLIVLFCLFVCFIKWKTSATGSLPHLENRCKATVCGWWRPCWVQIGWIVPSLSSLLRRGCGPYTEERQGDDFYSRSHIRKHVNNLQCLLCSG